MTNIEKGDDLPEINGNALPVQQNSVPTLSEKDGITEKRNKLIAFKKILQKNPPQALVRQHENYLYLPIEYYEALFRTLYFGQFQIVVTNVQQIFNEICVTVDLKLLHPVTGEWLTYSGVGSSQIMQNAGTKVADFAANKKPNALQTCLPKAKSEAVKNAAKQLGPIFGSRLNRRVEDFLDQEIVQIPRASVNA
jgi:hypothetical protein